MKRALCFLFLVTLVTVGITLAQAPQGAPAAPQRGAQAPAAAPGAAPAGGRVQPAPRIANFQANPTSIKPGESFVLSWTTENGPGTIDNGIGSVPTRGTAKITPKATTTYTLSVGTVTRSLTVTVAGTTPITPSAADSAATKPFPRTEGKDGSSKPDFSGIYGFTGMAGFGRRGNAPPAPPPSPYANLPADPTLKPGVQNKATPNPAGGTSDCLPLPADTAFGVPYPFQIFQNKNYVLLINEYPGTFRIIPIDEPHPADADPSWMGDSVGKWEGDTLVIDTIAYNGKHMIGKIQQPSESFHTIERLTRTSATTLFYEIVYEDPEVATGQWRASQTFTVDTRPGVIKISEFICENNRDYLPLFGTQGPPPAGGGGARGARGQ